MARCTFSLFLIIIFITSCRNRKEENTILYYDNLIVYSDLSNRLDRFPNDSVVVEQIVDFFEKDCVRPGVKINDRSALYFSKVNNQSNKCKEAKIDLEDIKNIEEKQRFVNNRAANRNLATAISQFKINVSCSYSERDKSGLDILSLLQKHLENGPIKKNSLILSDNGDTTFINYNNHVFLFTDGYLEYARNKSNDGFYLSTEKISMLRNICNKNKITPIEALNKNPQLRLKPIKSKNAHYTNLYVMETDDRGFNKEKGTIDNSGELSDNSILKVFWEKWAEDSGFKKIVWKETTRSNPVSNSYISKIIRD